MKMRKNNLDEMQEQKLLNIEHNGCWLAFWGLLIAMAAQMLLFGPDARILAGEWIVFMVLAFYLAIACMRAGIWDRRLQMNFRTNLLVSAVAGLAAGLFCGVFIYLRYEMARASLFSAAVMAVSTFLLCLLVLTLAIRSTKKRQEALEKEPEED